MSILKVANIHFETAGTNRIDYLGDDKVRINSGNGTVFSGSTTDTLLRITQTGSGDAIRIEDTTNPDATPFIVDANGDVIIGNAGVTAPATKLTVLEYGANRTLFYGQGNGGHLIIDYQGSSQTYLGANTFIIRNAASTAEFARIDAAGNVMIGRTDSTVGLGVKLDVNGAINCSNILVNGNAVSATGSGATITLDSVNATRYVIFDDATSGSLTLANVSTSLTFNPSTGTLSSTIFNSTSDEILKYDVKPIENPFAYLDEFNGVHFKWKKTNEPSLGVIAQDVEKVLPELVDSGIDHKTVNYNGIIAVLIQAVKELKAEIEVLKSK